MTQEERETDSWIWFKEQCLPTLWGRNYFHIVWLQRYHLVTQVLCCFHGGFTDPSLLPGLKWWSELQTKKCIVWFNLGVKADSESPAEVTNHRVQGKTTSHTLNQKLFQRQRYQAHSCDKYWNAVECHWGARYSILELHNECKLFFWDPNGKA